MTSILLGVVQGLTEFLPISSSGHLVLFQNLLGMKHPELLFDISLHMGTLVATCIYFRHELRLMIAESWAFILKVIHGGKGWNQIRQSRHAALTLWVLVGIWPTFFMGSMFRASLVRLFGSVTAVGFMLLLTGCMLAATKWIPKAYNTRDEVGVWIALAVGTAQGISLIPGISRSGTTIVCGIMCGLQRDLAARFSFLLSIPAIIGAMVFQMAVEGLERMDLLPLCCGFIMATVVGLIALKILMGVVRRGRLAYFAPYCWALALMIIFLT